MQRLIHYYDQTLFFDILKTLGYAFDKEGVCFGVAHMGIQSILAENIDHMIARSEIMYELQSENIPLLELLNAIKEKQLNKIELSKKEKMITEIPLFYEGVSLYQSFRKYPQLHSSLTQRNHQNSNDARSLISPIIFDNNKIEQHGLITGIYSPASLYTFFYSLKIMLNKHYINFPFALLLTSSNHAITVGFDEKKNSYFIIDANHYPIEYYNNEYEFTEAVFNAFNGTDYITMSTTSFVTKSNAVKFQNMFDSWLTYKLVGEDKTIHQPTPASAALYTDNEHISWLFIAALEGDIKTVQELLKNGANPDHADAAGFTALDAAVDHDHPDIVKLLLSYNANPNPITLTHQSSLQLADSLNHYECAETIRLGLRLWPLRSEISKLNDDKNPDRQAAIELLKIISKNATSFVELRTTLSVFNNIEKCVKAAKNQGYLNYQKHANVAYQRFAKGESEKSILQYLNGQFQKGSLRDYVTSFFKFSSSAHLGKDYVPVNDRLYPADKRSLKK